jgi:hypothetical protein
VGEERPALRFGAILAAIAALSLAAATAYATRVGAAGQTILGECAIPIEAVIGAGTALYRGAGVFTGVVRLAALAASALWIVQLLRRPVERRGAQPLLAALCLGWIAQSCLHDGYVLGGIALYAGVAATAALARRPQAAAEPLPVGLEMAAIVVLLLVFTGICLYRIDVHPNLYVDEMAYLRVARIFSGQVEFGTILGLGRYEMYVYDQFLAQTIPLLLQAAAVSLLPSDVITTRLLSVVAVAAALLVAVLVLRRPLGPRVTLWMLALCACAPLAVAYSRTGHYISISILHAVLCFASVLWLLRRWDVPSALVTGVALGCSLYQYQLSWFVPVFAVAVILTSPEAWRRPGAIKIIATVAIAGAASMLPGFVWLDTGLAAVNAQTFDRRAIWQAAGVEDPESIQERVKLVLAVAPDSLDEAGLEAFVARAEGQGLSAKVERSIQGETVVWVGGDRAQVENVEAAARRGAWLAFDFDWTANSPVARFRRMLAQLFYASDWESARRWIRGPLLNPLLSPLLVVGFVIAWRRRREPAVRVLLIWAVGGALLPAVVGGTAPRRTALMIPFAYGLMAFPVVEIGAELRRSRTWGRAVAAGVSIVLFGVVVCTSSHLYFRGWEHQKGIAGGGGMILDLVRLFKQRPLDEAVLMPKMFRELDLYLDAGDASRDWPERVIRRLNPQKNPAPVVLAMSCARPPPFTWMARDIPDHRAALAVVEKHFSVESDSVSGFRVLHVVAARDDICSRRSGARR